MSLKFMGASDCNLYVSLDAVFPLITDGRGEIRFGGVVPNQTSFVGIHVMAQFALNDNGANAANLSVSDAIGTNKVESERRFSSAILRFSVRKLTRCWTPSSRQRTHQTWPRL